MYIKDGIAYADDSTPILKITGAEILNDRNMLLQFNNGEKRIFDGKLLVGEVYMPLEDYEVFCQFKIDNGVMTWLDGEIDCAPEFMYEHGIALEQ